MRKIIKKLAIEATCYAAATLTAAATSFAVLMVGAMAEGAGTATRYLVAREGCGVEATLLPAA